MYLVIDYIYLKVKYLWCNYCWRDGGDGGVCEMAYVEKNTPSSPDPGTINVTLFFYGLMYEKKNEKTSQ